MRENGTYFSTAFRQTAVIVNRHAPAEWLDWSRVITLEHCNPWPHVANRHISNMSAIIIMTSLSLWRHSLLSWSRPALRTNVRTDTLPRLKYKDYVNLFSLTQLSMEGTEGIIFTFIPSNSDSGFHSCVSFSMQSTCHLSSKTYPLTPDCTGTSMYTCATCIGYRIQTTSTNKWLHHFVHDTLYTTTFLVYPLLTTSTLYCITTNTSITYTTRPSCSHLRLISMQKWSEIAH